MSKRREIVLAFVDLLGADRAKSFIDPEDLPKRSVFDLSESAEKQRFGKYTVSMPLIVQSLIDASSEDEGELLDNELRTIQVLMNTRNSAIDDLVESVDYVNSTYAYSQSGSSIIGLQTTFEIQYSFDLANP